jgi:hypothetical protein
VLDTNDPQKSDIVVLSVNTKAKQEIDDNVTDAQKIIDECETSIFSKVVYAAEKIGKTLRLVAVPGRDPYSLILQAAQKLGSSRIVVSQSSRLSLAEQKERIIRAKNELKTPIDATVEIVPRQTTRSSVQIQLGELQKAG